MSHPCFLKTGRLGVRITHTTDAEFIHALWTTPAVMRCVGFPKGLAIAVDTIRAQIERNQDSEFGVLLIAEILGTHQPIGQCHISSPDSDGICEPDIKLDPEYWGNGYGRELWAAMIDYAFTNSSANIVQGTPNRANTASIRMQQGAGMQIVDEGIFEPNLALHPSAVAVPYFKFQITRERWSSRHSNRSNNEQGKAA